AANARKLRLARAQIPEPWRMETFPFDQQPKLDKKKILSLYDAFDFITKKQNIIWVGPTGSGKTSLATGFLIEAIERDLTIWVGPIAPGKTSLATGFLIEAIERALTRRFATLRRMVAAHLRPVVVHS